MVCLARQVGTQGTSDGHRLNKRRASTEQATGIDWTSVGHRLNKRWAFIAHAVCTECPEVGQFLGTPYGLAALLLCIMPHDDFVILRWRFMILLWYFYDTSCKIIQNVSFLYLIICQLFIFTFSKKNDTLTLFHKKTFYVRAHTQWSIQKVSDWTFAYQEVKGVKGVKELRRMSCC